MVWTELPGPGRVEVCGGALAEQLKDSNLLSTPINTMHGASANLTLGALSLWPLL